MTAVSGLWPKRKRRGFTLLEILIVASIIAFLAGLAIINVKEFYDQTRIKSTYDECKTIGTALAFARDDVGFFPSIHTLAFNKKQMNEAGTIGGNFSPRPHSDAYGYLFENDPRTINLERTWKAGYLPAAASRQNISAASRGIGWGYVPYVALTSYQADYTPEFAKMPLDIWNRPYMIYLVTQDRSLISTENPYGVRLINDPSEEGDFFTAVVSYGPNGIPGGTQTTVDDAAYQAREDELREGRLFDEFNPRPAQTVQLMPNATLEVDLFFDFRQLLNVDSTQLANSLNDITGTGDPHNAGIRDRGSDDIYWEF